MFHIADLQHNTTYRCARSSECDARAKIEQMVGGDDLNKWRIGIANEHTCRVPSSGAGEPSAKRARTAGRAVIQASGHAENEDHLLRDIMADARDRHRAAIRRAILNRSVLLVSYGEKAPAMMRPTSWATEPHTFWARYVEKGASESTTTYSLSVTKINDIVSFDK